MISTGYKNMVYCIHHGKDYYVQVATLLVEALLSSAVQVGLWNISRAIVD